MRLGKQTMTLASLTGRNWLTTEMRVRINETKADQYAHEMATGDTFPAPVAFIDKKTEIVRVGDGFHRILAHRINGAKQIEVDLKMGNRLDAILHNIEANREQRGMPFSSGDKQKCIATLLKDPEASKWNQSRIAEIVGCSYGYVSTVVKLLGANRPDMIVDRLGYIRRKPVAKQDTEVAKRRVKIREMLLAGMEQTKIASALGIGRSTVQRCIEADEKEKKLVPCPHCHGTGIVKSKIG